MHYFKLFILFICDMKQIHKLQKGYRVSISASAANSASARTSAACPSASATANGSALSLIHIFDTGMLFLRILSPFYFVVSVKLVADGILRGCGLMVRFMIATFTDLILRVGIAAVLSATAPVSYTHLDVYKRQSLMRESRCWLEVEIFFR